MPSGRDGAYDEGAMTKKLDRHCACPGNDARPLVQQIADRYAALWKAIHNAAYAQVATMLTLPAGMGFGVYAG